MISRRAPIAYPNMVITVGAPKKFLFYCCRTVVNPVARKT